MGTNKRYADAVDRRMDERAVENIIRSGSPLSLSKSERDPLRLFRGVWRNHRSRCISPSSSPQVGMSVWGVRPCSPHGLSRSQESRWAWVSADRACLDQCGV